MAESLLQRLLTSSDSTPEELIASFKNDKEKLGRTEAMVFVMSREGYDFFSHLSTRNGGLDLLELHPANQPVKNTNTKHSEGLLPMEAFKRWFPNETVVHPDLPWWCGPHGVIYPLESIFFAFQSELLHPGFYCGDSD